MTITSLAPLSPPWVIAVTNRGPAGVGATIEVDPVVTVLAPGDPGEVVNTGNATHVVLEFSLPGGETGDVGPAPILTIGDVTDVAAGNAATAEINGPDGGPYTLDLGLPSGADGEDGVNAYVYVRYATASDGTGFSATPSDARIYMAVKTTTSPIASPVAGDFTGLWRLTKGIQGDAGTPGATGATGPAGEVTGSAALTDNMIVRGDGGVKVIQPTGITIDDSDRLLFGTANPALFSTSMRLQIHGTDDATTGIGQSRYSANSSAVAFRQFKSRAAAVGSHAVVQANDIIGRYIGLGDDGTNYIEAAEIRLIVDGTPGTNDMPGGIEFRTTADGAATGTLRAKIGQDGLFSALYKAYFADTLDLGHASDTTIARASAGRVNIENNRVMTQFVYSSAVSAAAASVIFTDIDAEDVHVIFDGVSHNNGSNTTWRMDFSTDNGSTWPQNFVVTASMAAAAAAFGTFIMHGLRSGFVSCMSAPISVNASWASIITESSASMKSAKMGAKVNALRFIPVAGAGDAGTIQLGQRG